jgi:hypothetical protein
MTKITCPACQGEGVIPINENNIVEEACTLCNSNGWLIAVLPRCIAICHTCQAHIEFTPRQFVAQILHSEGYPLKITYLGNSEPGYTSQLVNHYQTHCPGIKRQWPPQRCYHPFITILQETP